MNRLSCHRLSGFGFGFDVNKTEPWSDRPRGALYVRIWFLFWILAIDTGSEPYCKTKEERRRGDDRKTVKRSNQDRNMSGGYS